MRLQFNPDIESIIRPGHEVKNSRSSDSFSVSENERESVCM